MNRFAVIGLGHFGAEVARRLYNEGAEVIAIDADKERVQDAAEFSTQAIHADATESKTLEAVGLKEADVAIVSLGDRMDVITLTALHLKEIGCPYLIVKAISTDHEKILKAIGVNEVIHPEEFAARSLATRLSLFGVSEFLPILYNYSMVLLDSPACFVGKVIADLESKDVQVVGIRRGGTVVLSPSDGEIIQTGDTLILLGENKHLNAVSEKIRQA
jgi:trk system potassium uptake protein TrkA